MVALTYADVNTGMLSCIWRINVNLRSVVKSNITHEYKRIHFNHLILFKYTIA
jgi:hypothetical protein